MNRSAPIEVLELIERFDQHVDDYRAGKYNETQLRRDFLDPFFGFLGWDVDNSQGLAETYRDVIHEDAIKVGSYTKAPDYSFRIGGTRKFFVEAKKPSIDIKGEPGPAFQLRRYAWSAKLPLSILTDFEELAIYDCRIRPVKTDKASTARIHYWTYKDYPEKWDEIASIFSKDAVLKGSFDRYAATAKGKKGTAEVDSAFLDEIESWRKLLAKNIALRNAELTQRALNYAVQQTIDRIIFLRICEDRGIENYGQLQALQNGTNIYARLKEIYHRADERYNSGLFHFYTEPDRAETPDLITLNLEIDDKALKEVFQNLYYPDSPYEFSVLGVDILGSVYERFLGKVIHLTAGHHAKIEEKPEVKKAGGVYYTPTYIVDYIVQHTVGKLVEGKTPKQVEKLHILDPACGSGSFLIGAYQYLLDWHLKWYIEDSADKHAKGKNPKLYHAGSMVWRLTITERKRILTNNIYGVDIDSQAVEVTKLSLLLKLLEGKHQLVLYNQRLLPDLGNNIKCGNSLIGTDFYETSQLDFLDDENHMHINAFGWEKEFPEIMQAGGFDAVIGNPPWGASFMEQELEYFRSCYSRVIERMIDSYIYFIDRAIQIAKKEGSIGFIVPSTILNQVDARSVRELLLNRGLTAVISLGQGIFGVEVLNTSTILISSKLNQDTFFLDNLSSLPITERQRLLNKTKVASWKVWKEQVESDPHKTFFTGQLDQTALLSRLRQQHSSLQKMISGSIQRGVSPDVVAAHVVSKENAKSLNLENELLRPSVSGSQIKRYRNWQDDQLIIYTSRDTAIKNYPKTFKFLEQFKSENTCKEAKEGKHPWWGLHRPRDPQIFTSPKFIGLTTSKTIVLIYDIDTSVYVTDAMYVFKTIPEIDPWVFMGIMQSKVFLFLYRVSNQGESRVIPQVKASKLDTLPFPICNKLSPALKLIQSLSKRMYDLHNTLDQAITPHEKDNLKRQIEATDIQIDKVVYELYGLTEDEIKIVESTN
ncbi:MAG: N-6 DNA methylase [Gammaproteobacteria bacterium]|nr:N-6 DNA methylase [Gammaproteobacteria bacterium]